MNILWAFIVLGVGGFLLGLALAISSKLLHVEVDTRIEDITKMLPGYNCGACGNPGCSGLATNIVEGKATQLSVCKPGKADTNFNKIIEYLKNHPNEDGSTIDVKI